MHTYSSINKHILKNTSQQETKSNQFWHCWAKFWIAGKRHAYDNSTGHNGVDIVSLWPCSDMSCLMMIQPHYLPWVIKILQRLFIDCVMNNCEDHLFKLNLFILLTQPDFPLLKFRDLNNLTSHPEHSRSSVLSFHNFQTLRSSNPILLKMNSKLLIISYWNE